MAPHFSSSPHAPPPAGAPDDLRRSQRLAFEERALRSAAFALLAGLAWPLAIDAVHALGGLNAGPLPTPLWLLGLALAAAIPAGDRLDRALLFGLACLFAPLPSLLFAGSLWAEATLGAGLGLLAHRACLCAEEASRAATCFPPPPARSTLLRWTMGALTGAAGALLGVIVARALAAGLTELGAPQPLAQGLAAASFALFWAVGTLCAARFPNVRLEVRVVHGPGGGDVGPRIDAPPLE